MNHELVSGFVAIFMSIFIAQLINDILSHITQPLNEIVKIKYMHVLINLTEFHRAIMHVYSALCYESAPEETGQFILCVTVLYFPKQLVKVFEVV